MSTFAEFVQAKGKLPLELPIEALFDEPPAVLDRDSSIEGGASVAFNCVLLNASHKNLLIALHGTRFVVRSDDISAIDETPYSIPNGFGCGQTVKLSLSGQAKIMDVESSKFMSARKVLNALPFALARPSQATEGFAASLEEDTEWHKIHGVGLADSTYSHSTESSYISVTGLTGSTAGMSDDSGDTPSDSHTDDGGADD
jgi:hypothetical protein